MSLKTSAKILAVCSAVSLVWSFSAFSRDWEMGFGLGICWALGLCLTFWLDFRRDPQDKFGPLKFELPILIAVVLVIQFLGSKLEVVEMSANSVVSMIVFMVCTTLYRHRIAEYHTASKSAR